MTEIKQYSERDAMELDEVGGHYFRHVLAMTSEGLHSKSEIAAELGWRDMQIALLREQLSQLSISAGQADQRKAESDVVRVALGFSADADDVAPCDLVDAIAALQEQVRALAAEGSQMLQLLTDISEQCQECQSESEENVALIDLDYISEVTFHGMLVAKTHLRPPMPFSVIFARWLLKILQTTSLFITATQIGTPWILQPESAQESSHDRI